MANPNEVEKLLVGQEIIGVNCSWRPGDDPELTINTITLASGTKLFFMSGAREAEMSKSGVGPEINLFIRPDTREPGEPKRTY